MAINLNVDKYGAQFRAFVEFAAQQDHRAHRKAEPWGQLDAKITVSAHFELNPAQNNPMDIAQGV